MLLTTFALIYILLTGVSSSNGIFTGIGVFSVLLSVFSLTLVAGFFDSFGTGKREKLFRNFASQNGWKYTDLNQNDYKSLGWKNDYRLFLLGNTYLISGRVENMAYRSFENGQIIVFDYKYESSARHSYLFKKRQTVVVFQFTNFQLPYFALYPEGFFTGLGELIGFNDIDFASHPRFSSRYKLSGKDEARIRRIFHPQFLTYLENSPEIHIDGGGDYLFFYQKENLAPVEELNQFIGGMVNIFEAFRRYK